MVKVEANYFGLVKIIPAELLLISMSRWMIDCLHAFQSLGLDN